MKRGSPCPHRTSPPAAAQSSPNPTRAAPAPEKPCAVIATLVRCGNVAGSSPSRAKAAGRALVTRTSACSSSVRNRARPSSVRKSSASRALSALIRASSSGDPAGVGSGRPALSIRSTSAPARASNPAQSGPAQSADKSTTRPGTVLPPGGARVCGALSPTTATGNCSSAARSRKSAAALSCAAAATASHGSPSRPASAGIRSRSSSRARLSAIQPFCAAIRRHEPLAEIRSGAVSPPGASRASKSCGDRSSPASRCASSSCRRSIMVRCCRSAPSQAPAAPRPGTRRASATTDRAARTGNQAHAQFGQLHDQVRRAGPPCSGGGHFDAGTDAGAVQMRCSAVTQPVQQPRD